MSKKLLLAFVVLVIGYALYDFLAVEKSLKKQELEALIVPLKASQIQHLWIAKTGQPTLEFKRDAKGWLMLKPQEDVANEIRINAVLDGITLEKYTDKLSDNGNLGFNPPMGSISMANNLGEKIVVEIGSVKNFEGNAYLRKNGSKEILVASSTWFAKLDKSPSDYRDLRLMRIPASSVDKIVFKGGGKNLTLVNEEAQWKFSARKNLKVDQNKVREILSMLSATEGLEIVAEKNISTNDLKNWKLDPPAKEIEIYRGHEKSWSIAFGKTDKIYRVLISDPRWVLKVSPTDWDKFVSETNMDSLRDRGEPFHFDRLKVSKVNVKLEGEALISPKSDSEAFRTIVSRLSTMKLADFEPQVPGNYGFTNEVSFEDSDGKELIRFSWGKAISHKADEAPKVLAKSSLYPNAFTILEGDLDTMKLDQAKGEKK